MAGIRDVSAQFEQTWRPLIGFGVVFGFGVQPALPYINPVIVVMFVILAGTFYFISHEGHHTAVTEDKKIVLFGIWVGLAALCMFALGVVQFVATMSEITAPCQRMKLQLLSKPDSAISDTYAALHCPAVMPVHWPWE